MKFSHTTVLQNEMVSHVLTNTNSLLFDKTRRRNHRHLPREGQRHEKRVH